MSDLPTRDESKNKIWTQLYITTTGAPIVRAYGNGDLLTREEAANDEQVQRRVWQIHGLGWMLEADDE